MVLPLPECRTVYRSRRWAHGSSPGPPHAACGPPHPDAHQARGCDETPECWRDLRPAGTIRGRPMARKRPQSRRYPPSDVKKLFSRSAGRCGFPGCRLECVVGATAVDASAVIGEIAHIVAHGDAGPRADPSLSVKARDCYENWILLCPTHHEIVDVQPNSYTVADLRTWKADHERWVRERLADEMPNITFKELEVVTDALVGGPGREPTANFNVVPPAEKMRKNGLSDAVRWTLSVGLGKANEVADFVEHVAARSPAFPERLKAGFVAQYNDLRTGGLQGDALFDGLVEFASGGSRDFGRTTAGVAVLAYLFEKCEVFES